MLFIDNKYTTWYYQIINRALTREELHGYSEAHHIVPKSLGGSNNKINLVRLTAREHFICHWLLTKMVEGISRQKMAFALHSMLHLNLDRRYTNSVAYENNKIEVSKIKSITRKGVLVGEKNYNFGKKWTEEQRSKMRGHTRNVGKKKKPHSNDAKKLMSISAKSRWTKEARLEQSIKRLTNMYHFLCPHCGKSGKGVSNYNRWHGDKCKSLNR